MARAAQSKMQKTQSVVTLTTNWQLAFVTAMAVSQLGWAWVIAWGYTRHGQYVSAATWVWQLSTWTYPLLYVAVGYWFARWRKIGGAVPRLFWGFFLAALGFGIYTGCQAILNWLLYSELRIAAPMGTDWWASFGHDWSLMIAVFALFWTAVGVGAKGKRA